MIRPLTPAMLLLALLTACASAPDPVAEPPAEDTPEAPATPPEPSVAAPMVVAEPKIDRGSLVAVEENEEGKRLEEAAQRYQERLEDMFIELKDELDACYLPQLKRNPSLAGYIIVEFKVIKGGKLVEGPRVSEDGLRNPAVEKCVIDLIKAQPYPEPFNGQSTDVRRRFVFGAF